MGKRGEKQMRAVKLNARLMTPQASRAVKKLRKQHPGMTETDAVSLLLTAGGKMRKFGRRGQLFWRSNKSGKTYRVIANTGDGSSL